jgi:hypothetical protein
VRATAAARAVLGRAEGRSCAWSRQRKTPAIGKPQPLSTPAARRLGQHVGGRHSGDQQAAARQLQTSQVVSLNCILANIGFICPFACVPWCKILMCQIKEELICREMESGICTCTVVNLSGSSSAELLATFCDNILKKGCSEKLSDEAIEDALEKVHLVFSFAAFIKL